MKRILFVVLLFVCGMASAQYREPWVTRAKSTSSGTHDSIWVNAGNAQPFHLLITDDGSTATDTLWCARNTGPTTLAVDTARAARFPIKAGEVFAPPNAIRASSIRLWSSSGNAIPYRFLAY
jgi:hypothetical protein